MRWIRLPRDAALRRQARPRARVSDSRPRSTHLTSSLPPLLRDGFPASSFFCSSSPQHLLLWSFSENHLTEAEKGKHFFSNQGSWLCIRETLPLNWAGETDS